MTVLLDTSVIIDTLNRRNGRREFVLQLLADGHTLACCTVTVAEIYAGMKPHEAPLTERFFDTLVYYVATKATARAAGELKAVWTRKGHTLALPDLMIAAVAIENNLMLATDNRRHFPMPGLKLLPLPAMQ